MTSKRSRFLVGTVGGMADRPAAWDPSNADVLHLKLPNKVQLATIGQVLNQLEPALRGNRGTISRLLLDMSSVAFASPTGITIVAAGIEHLFTGGRIDQLQIWLPRSPLLVQYLQRMNFFNEMNVSLEEKFKRREPKRFRPVTHVPNEDVSPGYTRDLLRAVESSHELDTSTRNALKTCVNELIENVFYHAQSPVDALVAVQAYKKKNVTELVIADTGRGIRAALGEKHEYRDRVQDDCSAIKLAIQKNVTTTDDPKRGIGLWVASELVRQNEGRMLIMSHDGGVNISGDGQSNVQAHFWPGTLIAIEFRMDRPITVGEVYDSGNFPDADSFDF
jgi:anti-sigma regulatory factor (Ser/Thr protein kinase)